MKVSIFTFLFTFTIFLNSVAPTDKKAEKDKKRRYVLFGPDNKPVEHPLCLITSSIAPDEPTRPQQPIKIAAGNFGEFMTLPSSVGLSDKIAQHTLHLNPSSIAPGGAGTSTSLAIAVGAPPTNEQIKALLDSAPNGRKFCIHMRKSGQFFIGKFQTLPKDYLPSWIRNRAKAPYSDERVYIFNPDRIHGLDAASTSKNVINGIAAEISLVDVRAYVKIDGNHFFTAKLLYVAQKPKDHPIWPIAGTDHQIFVRLPGCGHIVRGVLSYLPGNLVPEIIEEIINKMP